MNFLKRFLPFLSWFENYTTATLRADLIAGLTVALVLVPQSMAYAQLAGLPAYYGLYAAFLPPMIASLFGSSRQLATGPVAVVSLMTSAALEPLATAGSEQYIAYALLLALAVGVFQLCLGILKLGIVVNFLSHPVINGFTNAAALIIATSQLSKIFGVYVDKAPHHYETIWRVLVAAVHFTHWPSLGMAVISFATIIVLRRINPRIPTVLVAVIVTTGIAWIIGFEQNETIKIDQIASPRVSELINVFNSASEAKETLEAHRATSKQMALDVKINNPGSCSRCHDIRAFTQHKVESASRKLKLSGHALALHDLAGLFDRRIGETKGEISQHREEMRASLFVRAIDQDGRSRFFRRDEVPDGVSVQPGTWRIKVGNTRLKTDELLMIGGGAVVAEIPRGLPAIRAPEIDWTILLKLLSSAMIISLLGFMEAISIAKAMAARTRQKLDPNQELIGQGLANIVGCFGRSYAVSGSFSRSAVNLQAGGKTGLSNVFSSVVVVIVLLFLSEGLYHLPQSVLASIIMMAVFGLLNVSGFTHAWRTSRFDGAVNLITFAATLWFAPHLEWGVFIGVGLSLGAYLYRSMRPQVIELAPHPDGSMRDARRMELQKCRHIAVVSFEGPLNFASTNYLEGEILSRVSELPELRQLLISGNGISEVDASGEETIRQLVQNLRGAGYAVSFSGVPDKIMDVFRRSRCLDLIGEENFYSTRSQAIAAIYTETHVGSTELDCPYHSAMPPVVELSLHGDGSLRNAERHGLRTCQHIAALRFDAPLNFANTSFLEQEILRKLADRPKLRHILFVSHGINDIDDTGAVKLKDLIVKLKADNFAISFSGLKEEVLDVLERNNLTSVLDKENMYPTQVMATAAIYARAHTGSSEKDCPLWNLAPHLIELSLHDSKTLREVDQHHLRVCQEIGVLRLDGALVLSNWKGIQSEFIRWAKARPTVTNVIFLMSALGKFDEISAQNLVALVDALHEADYHVLLANINDRAFEDLARGGYADAIGLENIYLGGMLSIIACYSAAHQDSDEENCPLRDILPHMTELSLHPDGSFRNAYLHGLALCERIAVIRFDGPLNVATLGYFEGAITSLLSRRREIRHILIAAHTLAIADLVAAEAFPEVLRRLRNDGYNVSLSGVKDADVEMLSRAGGGETMGADFVFPTQAKAISAIYADAHQDAGEKVCPLIKVVWDKDGDIKRGQE